MAATMLVQYGYCGRKESFAAAVREGFIIKGSIRARTNFLFWMWTRMWACFGTTSGCRVEDVDDVNGSKDLSLDRSGFMPLGADHSVYEGKALLYLFSATTFLSPETVPWRASTHAHEYMCRVVPAANCFHDNVRFSWQMLHCDAKLRGYGRTSCRLES